MWSRVIAIILMAAFLMAVSTPVLGHSGRISNRVEDPIPDGGDEHPWGGDEDPIVGPTDLASSLPDPWIYSGTFFFIRIAVDYYWISIRHHIAPAGIEHQPTDDVKPSTAAIPTPLDDSRNDQEAGDK